MRYEHQMRLGQIDEVTGILEEMSWDGWELVSALLAATTICLFFKRPARS